MVNKYNHFYIKTLKRISDKLVNFKLKIYNLGDTGVSVVQQGESAVREVMAPKVPRHWKTIKFGGSSRLSLLNLPERKLSGYAPKLGVRETYRTKAERLLNENSLYKKISSTNIKDGANLDKIIACGNHIVDLHGSSGINTSAINADRKPYGVPYGSLIPKGLKNVFVAGRCAGYTHIAAASFRLNKDMMQTGWAAGHAAKMCLLGNYQNTRDVDVELLQSENYTNFVAIVKQIDELT